LPQIPPDAEIVRISRAIGQERLVDEMIFRFTHTVPMDWMLPGVALTRKRVEMGLVVIVQFNGDTMLREHFYWDQAS
jgi:carboxymethylenebutenolidase